VNASFARMRSWLRSVISRQRLEGEMEEEIRFHQEARAQDLIRQGLTPRQAARQARVWRGRNPQGIPRASRNSRLCRNSLSARESVSFRGVRTAALTPCNRECHIACNAPSGGGQASRNDITYCVYCVST
jgi:hypothetical protein